MSKNILKAVLCILPIILIVFSLFFQTKNTLNDILDVNEDQIESAYVRVSSENGSRLLKIENKKEVYDLCSSLSSLKVKRHLSFGATSEIGDPEICFKLKGGKSVNISSRGNCFSSITPLSSFIFSYYDVIDSAKFSNLVNSFSA